MTASTFGISIIAHNEAAHLPAALESAVRAGADQIIVVDCDSTDDTAAIARSHPLVKLFQRPNLTNLNINKSFGFEQLTTDWIFYLDPDERIPEPLGREIRSTIDGPLGQSCAAFRLPRRNFFFGRPLLHGGQYPDRQLRLFRRGRAKFPNRHVHESLEVDGSIGLLNEPFDHHPYPAVDDFLRKMNFYTSFQADFWHEEGRRPSLMADLRFFAARPLSRFLRRYLLKAGFRDGWQGFIAALGDAFSIAIAWGKLHERCSRPAAPQTPAPSPPTDGSGTSR